MRKKKALMLFINNHIFLNLLGFLRSFQFSKTIVPLSIKYVVKDILCLLLSCIFAISKLRKHQLIYLFAHVKIILFLFLRH